MNKRKKRLSLAPEALETLEEVTEEQIATSKLERAKAIQQQNDLQNAQVR